MKEYHKIRQFRDSIEEARKSRSFFVGLDKDKNPIFDYKDPKKVIAHGTVKIHGQNAGIEFKLTSEGWDLKCQSRIQELTSDNTLNGFVDWVSGNRKELCWVANKVSNIINSDKFVIFGEWAGKGNQNGCAIHELSKRFIVFDVYNLETEKYEKMYDIVGGVTVNNSLVSVTHRQSIFLFNINQYKTFNVGIDISNPEKSMDVINGMTKHVEENCPVATQMAMVEGVELKNTIGEGIVWKFRLAGDEYIFKTKGLKHKKHTEMKATIDPILAKGIEEFVERTVTEERCLSILKNLENEKGRKLEKSDLKDLMPRLYQDIMDEEGDAKINGEPVTRKIIARPISDKGREFFLREIDKF